MEIRGTNEQGQVVSASVPDLVEKIRNQGEIAQMTQVPHIYEFHGQQGQTRTVDLQEMAQAGGLSGVGYRFDPEAARAKGLMQDRPIDAGVAYNLERIERDEDKISFLKSKGFTNLVRSGEDFYETLPSGRFAPVNNKDGLDWSDVIRVGAHLGRDVGAGIAARAAVGATVGAGVAAGPSGVAAGIGAGIAAGAVGGSVGELGQRLLDKGLGAEADKYNSQMGLGDEAARAAGTAGMGAMAGAAEPLMMIGGAAAKGAIAPALYYTGRWSDINAAKAQAGELTMRLPGGYMQKFASEGQAAAQDLMDQGMTMAGRGALNGEELRGVTAEAQSLARGVAKPAGDVAAEEGQQAAMRSAYESQTIQGGLAREAEAQAKALERTKIDAAYANKEEVLRKQATEVYAHRKGDLEKVLDPKADMQESIAARNSIVNEQVTAIAKEAGIKVEYVAGTKQLQGLDGATLGKFITKEGSNILDAAESTLLDARKAAPFLEQVPTDTIKGSVVADLRTQVTNLPTKVADEVRSLIDSIDVHGTPAAGGIHMGEQMTDVHRTLAKLERTAQPDIRATIENVRGALETYDMAATSSPDAVRTFYTGARQVAGSWPKVLREAYPDHFENAEILNSLRRAGELTGDPNNFATKKLGTVMQLDFQLQNPASKSPFELPSDIAKSMRLLDYVATRDFGGRRNLSTGQVKVGNLMSALKDIPVPGLRGGVRLGAMVAEGVMSALPATTKALTKASSAAADFLVTSPYAAPVRSTVAQEFEEGRSRKAAKRKKSGEVH